MPENEKETGSEGDDTLIGEESFSEDETVESKTEEEKKPVKKAGKVDNLIKRDVAFLQKKLAELEIAVSEVQESIQKTDTSDLEELKQRVGDIEDLTMVENAGVIEMKKMLEEIRAKTEETKIPPGLEEKITALEQKIASLPDISEFESRMKEVTTTGAPNLTELESSIQASKEDFQNKLNEINTAISELKKRLAEGIDVEEFKKEITDYVTTAVPEFPDVAVIKKKLEDSIASTKIDIETLKKEFGRIRQDIEEKLNAPLQDKLLKELEEIKNESLINSSKVDGIDAFVKRLTKDISEVRPLINKLNSRVESFEGLGDVERAIDEKLHEFRSVLATAETIKEGSQPFKEIDRVLARFRDIEGRLSEMKTSIEEFEKSKEEILSLKWKTDYKKLADDLNRKFEKLEKEIESRVYKETSKGLKDRVLLDIQEIKSSFDKKTEAYDNLIKLLGDDLSILQGNVMALENKTSGVDTRQLIERIISLENNIENIRSTQLERTNQLKNNINELERQIPTQLSAVIDELVNRLVFLESRLVALEGTLTTTGSYPIILE